MYINYNIFINTFINTLLTINIMLGLKLTNINEYITLISENRKNYTKYCVIIFGCSYLFLGLDFMTSMAFSLLISFFFIYYAKVMGNGFGGSDNLIGKLVNGIGQFTGMGNLVPNQLNNINHYNQDNQNDSVNLNNVFNELDKSSDKLNEYVDKHGGSGGDKSKPNPKYDGFMGLIDEFKQLIRLMTQYINKIRDKFKDKSDNSFKKIIKSLVSQFKKFTKQLKLLFTSIDKSSDYPNLIYQKIRDIESEITDTIHSLHFKLDANSDKDIFKYTDGLKKGFSHINQRLEHYIEKDLEHNPSSKKGSLQVSEDHPNPVNS